MVFNLPDGLNINNLVDDLKLLSWQASDILLNYSRNLNDKQFKDNFIMNKKNNEPVTQADLEVNNLILKHFKNNYLNINWNILSEERISTISNNEITSDWQWVLDPLDGTKDFIQGTGNFAMHLALNFKNKPYLGIVLIPKKDELWIANGQRVWCEKRNGLNINPNSPSQKNIKDMIIVTSKNHRNKSLERLINKIGFKEVIEMGSIGCKIASLLRGEADIYISLSFPDGSAPKDWDFAAPEAVLSQAGGAITYIDNKALIYNQSEFRQQGLIVASNNKMTHKTTCSVIKDIVMRNNIFPLYN
tara:strand:+ start:184 stop:1092 length:909 start_codon:yes stop_codon:yes gene_type:complete